MPKKLEFDIFSEPPDALDGFSVALWESMLRGKGNPLDQITNQRPTVDIVGFNRDLRKAIRFKPIDDDLVVTEDTVGFERVLSDGRVETYPDKMALERKRGQNEAVSYGIGRIRNHKIVAVIHNWEFMVGSSGVVAREKYLRAAELAAQVALPENEREQMPLVVFCPTAGQRQQEGVASLRVLPANVYAFDDFKQKTDQPLVFVLVGHTWGGIMASAVTAGDVVIGMAGSDAGFAGPSVIEAYEQRRPPTGAQSVENLAATNRSIHVILNTQQELLEYLEKLLDISAKKDKPPGKPKKSREISGIYFNHRRYHVPIRPNRVFRDHPRTSISLAFDQIGPKSVWDQHRLLRSDPRRPDTLYILQNGFDGCIPLFSGSVEVSKSGKHLKYPGIVAALAYIDDPRLQKRLMRMVIGNQPSYWQQPDETVMMELASPTSWDYRYQLKMMNVARRWGVALTSFVNTLGARPKLTDDLATQYEAIHDCLRAQIRFPFFTSGYLIGIGGSGGHIATDFTLDYAAMLSGAQEFVAEPVSSANMVYKRPGTSDFIRTAETMRPTAQFLLGKGLIDKVIWEPDGGAQNHPLETVRKIREDIILTELEFSHLTPEEIMDRRIQRIRNPKIEPIPIGHLSGRVSEDHRSILNRLLHRKKSF